MKALYYLAAALFLFSPTVAHAGRCNPNGICRSCSNCSACKNCSENGGTCSVCTVGARPSSTPTRTFTPSWSTGQTVSNNPVWTQPVTRTPQVLQAPPGYYYNTETRAMVPIGYVFDRKKNKYVWKGAARSSKPASRKAKVIRTVTKTAKPASKAQPPVCCPPIPDAEEASEFETVTSDERLTPEQEEMQRQLQAAQKAAFPAPTKSRAKAAFVPAEFSGKVVGVSDGDTITVLYQQSPIKVRLYGIDSPEKAQAFGQQAKNFTSKQVFGKVVKIYSKGGDRYHRTLGWVFIGGELLNTSLVENGLAWWYRQYSPKEAMLGKMETQARAKKVGLWADANPVAPWEFRRKK